MPDEPQPHAEAAVGLDAAQAEDTSAELPPAPRNSTAHDDLDELEDTIPGRPMAQLLARHAAARVTAEPPAHDTPDTLPSEPTTTESVAPEMSPADDEATVAFAAPLPILDDAAPLADGDAAAPPDASEMHLPAEPAGGDAGFAAARAPDDADTPIPPAAAEMPTAPFPEPGRDTYAGARTQPTPSIPEVTAPTEPMPPIMRDTGVLGQSDAGAQPAPPQPSQHHLASRHATPTDPPPAGQVTPRLGMPPIDALAANGHGNGNGHHGAALAPRPGRARPAALARPRMVEVSGVHSRVPPEYWLDDDPIEETRLSLGLQGARAVKTEAGRPLPPPRRFKRAPRWLTIVVLLVVTAAVAACVGGAISIASIYLQRPHTTGPVPASTVAPKASPTVPKR